LKNIDEITIAQQRLISSFLVVSMIASPVAIAGETAMFIRRGGPWIEL